MLRAVAGGGQDGQASRSKERETKTAARTGWVTPGDETGPGWDRQRAEIKAPAIRAAARVATVQWCLPPLRQQTGSCGFSGTVSEAGATSNNASSAANVDARVGFKSSMYSPGYYYRLCMYTRPAVSCFCAGWVHC